MPTPSTIELPSDRYVFACIADRRARGGAHVYTPQRHFAVTNLGWLLRHAREVHDFYVSTFRMDRGYNVSYDAMLAARLDGGKVYVTDFADPIVLKTWLDRPRFHGQVVHWNGRTYIVGSKSYRRALL